MINHARTLLLNQNGAEQTYSDPLAEYVDPAFKAQTLPPYLQSLWQALFGLGSSSAFLNYRLRQYMYILHSTEFSSYVLALDSRITYLHPILTPVAINSPVVTVMNNLNGAYVGQLFSTQAPYSIFGQLFNNNAYFQYQLSGALLAFIYRAEDFRNNVQ